MAIYAIEVKVLNVVPCSAEGTRISAGKFDFTDPLSSPFSVGDEFVFVSKDAPVSGGTVIGVTKGRKVLFTDPDVCPSAVRFASLLYLSRYYGFMQLAEEDRIWLMEQMSHEAECADCQAVRYGHKALGG